MKLFSIALILSSVPLAAQNQLPESEGKKVVERICNQCHSPENYTRTKHTEDEWETIVDNMVERGATGTDNEFETVVLYLARNFGKVKAERPELRASADRNHAKY